MYQVLKTLVLCLALIVTNLALAQGEPSMAEIYAAAQSGHIDKAQSLIQQVLITHPNSAKAHFVRAELFAKEGKLHLAQEALAEAERLSPGLPFAKPDAVAALKAQIGSSRLQNVPVSGISQPLDSHESHNFNWIFLLVATGGVIAAGYFLFRNKQPQLSTPYAAAPTSAFPGSTLSGPQTFGATPSMGYPTAPMPPSEPSMGSRIMGGVATGLAVGAGVVAAEAIGRQLMGHGEPSSPRHDSLGASSDFTPISANPDMGGDNFGIADTRWDDADPASTNSDWDN